MALLRYHVVENVQFRTEDDPEWKPWDFSLSHKSASGMIHGEGNWLTGIAFNDLEDAIESMDQTIKRSYENPQTNFMVEIPGIDPATNEVFPDSFRSLVCTHSLVQGTYFLITFYVYNEFTDLVPQWRM